MSSGNLILQCFINIFTLPWEMIILKLERFRDPVGYDPRGRVFTDA